MPAQQPIPLLWRHVQKSHGTHSRGRNPRAHHCHCAWAGTYAPSALRFVRSRRWNTFRKTCLNIHVIHQQRFIFGWFVRWVIPRPNPIPIWIRTLWLRVCIYQLSANGVNPINFRDMQQVSRAGAELFVWVQSVLQRHNNVQKHQRHLSRTRWDYGSVMLLI